jgi:membrane protease YdiL (CAAX protease family)
MFGLGVFVLATFAWTWGFYAPIAFGGHSPYEMPWLVLLILGGMGPSLIGVACVLLSYSPEERSDYWRRAFSISLTSPGIWLFALIAFPVIYGIASLIGMWSGSQLPGAAKLSGLLANPVQWPFAVFLSFMSGPWSEEFGWRGFAQDRVIRAWGPIPGSIALGVVWGVWHLPLYFMAGTWHAATGLGLTGFWTFVAGNVGLSLIITWTWMRSGHSILSAMVVHFAINFTTQLLAPIATSIEVTASAGILALGIALVLVTERGRALRTSGIATTPH